MTTVVVGLGKIGLPLSLAIAGAGEPVIGLDVSETTVDELARGRAPFPGEPELEERLARCMADGTFLATTDADFAIPQAGTVIVVVPLMIDAEGEPDFATIEAATGVIGRLVKPGTLVSYETTVPVGTTRTRLAPLLCERSGLRLGVDLFVCHSPERVSSGRVFSDLRRYPKLVGGVDIESERRAVRFYERVLTFDDREDLPRPNGVWPLRGAEAAEFAKLAETTYRDLNIAYANELAVAAERLGVDLAPVIEACNSQPYSHVHHPGIWVGGHCIPVYPHLFMSTVPGLRLPLLAREVNVGMADHAVSQVDAALGGLRAAKVVVLGLAFRGGVKEDAFSGTHPLVTQLREGGATAVVHDPLYSDEEVRSRGLEPFALGDPCDAVILHTDHSEYRQLGEKAFPGVRVVYDGRGVLDPDRFPSTRFLLLGHSNQAH